MDAAKAYDKWAMTIPGRELNFPSDAPKRQLSDLRKQVFQKVEDALVSSSLKIT